jgi:hypothetical protein
MRRAALSAPWIFVGEFLATDQDQRRQHSIDADHHHRSYGPFAISWTDRNQIRLWGRRVRRTHPPYRRSGGSFLPNHWPTRRVTRSSRGLSADGTLGPSPEANNPNAGIARPVKSCGRSADQTDAKADDQQIIDAMSGNICAAAYLRIRQAIKSAAGRWDDCHHQSSRRTVLKGAAATSGLVSVSIQVSQASFAEAAKYRFNPMPFCQ